MWFSRVLSGIWYYLQVVGIYLSFPFGAPLSTRTPKKTRVLTGSTFGIYSRFISRMQTKQRPADSLNILMTHCSLQLCLCLFCNQILKMTILWRQPVYRCMEIFRGIYKLLRCLSIDYTLRCLEYMGSVSSTFRRHGISLRSRP